MFLSLTKVAAFKMVPSPPILIKALKSLFNVAVSYLKSIAGEIANLKQDAGTLGISTDQALKLKNQIFYFH